MAAHRAEASSLPPGKAGRFAGLNSSLSLPPLFQGPEAQDVGSPPSEKMQNAKVSLFAIEPEANSFWKGPPEY